MNQVVADNTSPRQRRRIRWTQNLNDQLAFLQWTPKKFHHELREAGCSVTRQAVDQWLSGETAPSLDNQVFIAKVTRSAQHVLFPAEVA